MAGLNKRTRIQKLGNISASSVEKHTGRNWDQWIAVLDKQGGRSLSHKEITALLKTKFKQAPWWQFSVALGYQYHTGQKTMGVNAKGEHAVAMSRTIAVTRPKLWKWALSSEGQALWLKPLSPIEIAKDVEFEIEGGIFGKIRTMKAPERVRFSWQDTEWEKPTVAQLILVARQKDKCVFGISHEGIRDARVKQELKDMWRARLDEVSAFFKA